MKLNADDKWNIFFFFFYVCVYVIAFTFPLKAFLYNSMLLSSCCVISLASGKLYQFHLKERSLHLLIRCSALPSSQ